MNKEIKNGEDLTKALLDNSIPELKRKLGLAEELLRVLLDDCGVEYSSNFVECKIPVPKEIEEKDIDNQELQEWHNKNCEIESTSYLINYSTSDYDEDEPWTAEDCGIRLEDGLDTYASEIIERFNEERKEKLELRKKNDNI